VGGKLQFAGLANFFLLNSQQLAVSRRLVVRLAGLAQSSSCNDSCRLLLFIFCFIFTIDFGGTAHQTLTEKLLFFSDIKRLPIFLRPA
jgi:hypothetical protein